MKVTVWSGRDRGKTGTKASKHLVAGLTLEKGGWTRGEREAGQAAGGRWEGQPQLVRVWSESQVTTEGWIWDPTIQRALLLLRFQAVLGSEILRNQL